MPHATLWRLVGAMHTESLTIASLNRTELVTWTCHQDMKDESTFSSSWLKTNSELDIVEIRSLTGTSQLLDACQTSIVLEFAPPTDNHDIWVRARMCN